MLKDRSVKNRAVFCNFIDKKWLVMLFYILEKKGCVTYGKHKTLYHLRL